METDWTQKREDVRALGGKSTLDQTGAWCLEPCCGPEMEKRGCRDAEWVGVWSHDTCISGLPHGMKGLPSMGRRRW